MNTGEKSSYFKELTINLRHRGFTVKPETEDGLLPVELEGRRLCCAASNGGIRYWTRDTAGEARGRALDTATDIVKATSEYMSRMETAPRLTADGLTGDYRLLAEFGSAVLAGHPTQYGIQFVTWEWDCDDRTSLGQGHFYGPGMGADNYAIAKQDFAVRSGLVPQNALFTPEQLTEIYRSLHDTLYGDRSLTDERRKCLESAAEQIEQGVPALDERAEASRQREEVMQPRQDGGIKFHF